MDSSSTNPVCSSVGAPFADSRPGDHPDLPAPRRSNSLSPTDVTILQSASATFDSLSALSSSPSGSNSATRKILQKRKSEPEETTLHHPCVPLPKRSRQMGLDHPEDTNLLADKLRPRTLDEFVGQTHLTGRNTLLFSEDGELTAENIIFWGPPG